MAKRLPSPPPVLAGLSYVRPLGSGGFADVFLYEQDMPRRGVAVKVLPNDVHDAELLRMFNAEADVLAYMAFPAQHRTKLHSTNPLERLNKEVKRRADVVGIFPNEDSIVRLIGAVLLEANDEWQLLSRYMQVEAMAELNPPTIEEETTLQITPRAA